MAFSQTNITGVTYKDVPGGNVKITWTSSSPAGTVFQAYVNRSLIWSGTTRTTTLKLSPGDSVDIGEVGAGEGNDDFSGSLPTTPETRVRLEWLGGFWEGLDLAGWRVYGEAEPGGGIDYDTPLADIQAYVEGSETDGYGYGEFDGGGFGYASGNYSWTSDPYTSGLWAFAVVPYDRIGNEGTGATITKAVLAPPGPPSRLASGNRVDLEYSPSTHQVTLTWGESETAA